MLFGGHIKSPADIRFLRDSHFDFGELVFKNNQSRHFWRRTNIKNHFDDGFFMIAHGPVEGPPNDLDQLWERCHPSYLDTIDAAAEMQIQFLTLHLWVDSRFVKQEVIREKIKMLRNLVSYGANRGVQVSLENLSEPASDLATVLESVPGLVLTLDVGHGQILAQTNTSIDIIEHLGRFIGHIHLHDNRGGSGPADDLHLPIGEGIIDFPNILGALVGSGYEGTITLELQSAELNTSKERVQRMLDAPYPA